MIRQFRIRNYKILRELDLALGQLTVMVGPNACGKSSVLRAMTQLCAMKVRAPRDIFTGDEQLDEVVTRGASEPVSLAASGVTEAAESEPGGVPWALEWRDRDRDRAVSDPYEREATLQWRFGEQGEEQPRFWMEPLSSIDAGLTGAVPTVAHLHFTFEHLAAPAVITPEPELTSTGRGLAAVLGHLALQYPADFIRIKEAALSVISSIKDIRLRNTLTLANPPRTRSLARSGRRSEDERTEVPAHELLFDTHSGSDIPAHAMSDGTLRVLGLLTVALGRTPPQMILLDDLERGVHPRAMIDLVSLLRRSLQENLDLQVVASTHSPDLLDQLEPEQIRLLWIGDDGYTRCVAMPEHPDYAAWQAIMTPGEMWGVFDRDREAAS
ncbi:AAA family ATPase [Haliangium sp.]|uniref:AAA family ATPase n=1 Tax=Haliangium sp. TaxID=2663208 RepID=UPI003D0E7B55